MQKNLFFEHTKPMGLTISEVADKVNVSSSTVSNWIKAEYLKEIKRGIVDKTSLNRFLKQVAGKEKLTLRANKSMRDSHNHKAVSELVRRKINSGECLEIDKKYEQSLSNSYRNEEGIYYTPTDIADNMLEGIEITADTTFLDPCCGSGNFILQAIRRGVKPENAFGFDIDHNAVEITKKRIFDLTGFDAQNNIKKIDLLENSHRLSKQRKYDLIFTNPPWGKKLKKKEKDNFATLYGAGKSVDSTSLFYFASMFLLKPKGRLGFLVQQALFNISTFRDSRKNILKNKVLRLIDYDKPFKGLMTKAFAFVIEKNDQKNERVQCQGVDSKHSISQDVFINNPKSILNFWINKDDADVIKHVYQLPHSTLKGKASWGLGIVTGNNSKFCNNNAQKGYLPVYRGSDISSKGLKEPSSYVPDDFSKYQQVAPLSKYRAPKKLIYRFISSKLVFFCDTEQRFILNSANLVIPDKSMGLNCNQLADLFNSKFMNWLFGSLFGTHKILRGDIERLPIHTGYFKENDIFCEKSFLTFLGLIKRKDGTYRIR